MAQYDSGSTIILVNGRLISDRLLLKSLRDGFDSTLKPREFPVGFIRLDIDPTSVDVNVHPQKSEVRFRDPSRVYGFVREAISKAVRSFRSPVQFQSFSGGKDLTERGQATSPSAVVPECEYQSGNLALQPRESELQPSIASLQSLSRTSPDENEALISHAGGVEEEGSFRFSQLRYLGQALQCYLFCELNEKVYVVDMHAAHERYNYNLVRNGFTGRELPSQRLLVPITVEMTERGAAKCIEQSELFLRFGFDIEPFGDTAVLVRSVPSIVLNSTVEPVFKEVAAITEEEEAARTQAGEVFQQLIDRVAARIACHASIRSGKKMTEKEVYALFDSLDTSEFSAACPHGRPVVVSFSEPDIEKWFGRDR
jgi:DNA mismatch repair protein MutL